MSKHYQQTEETTVLELCRRPLCNSQQELIVPCSFSWEIYVWPYSTDYPFKPQWHVKWHDQCDIWGAFLVLGFYLIIRMKKRQHQPVNEGVLPKYLQGRKWVCVIVYYRGKL